MYGRNFSLFVFGKQRAREERKARIPIFLSRVCPHITGRLLAGPHPLRIPPLLSNAKG
jgi:hypothetical protein